MIRELALAHFKCFEGLRLPIRPLTLLTGINASGKSTVIQALALLRQTADQSGVGAAELNLDGAMVSLGAFADVVDQVHGHAAFGIGIKGDLFDVQWTFGGDGASKRDLVVPVQSGRLLVGEAEFSLGGANGGLLSAAAIAEPGGVELVELLTGLSYVCADRTGPREVYPLGDPDRHRLVGKHGELAPGLVYWFGDDHVLASLRLDGPPTLARQTDAWLDHFFPGASHEVLPVPSANLVTLGLRTSLEENFHRPQNVGFGLSHLFPIVVALLHARPGELVVIENPEVHLHPRAQSQVGYFIARVAGAGVQVLIETHSDHVLNGVRRAVRDRQMVPGDVAVHFFRPRGMSDAGSQVTTPVLDVMGNVDAWPDGFFDQFEEDLRHLAGL